MISSALEAVWQVRPGSNEVSTLITQSDSRLQCSSDWDRKWTVSEECQSAVANKQLTLVDLHTSLEVRI